MTRVYLDYNATAPLRPEARAAMIAAMDILGNPSSVHAEGRAATGSVAKARAQVAEAVGCKPDEVVFTSGATEAAQVLAGRAVVDPAAHDALWAQNDPSVNEAEILAVGLANSETGVLTQPEQSGGLWRCGALSGQHLCLDVTQAIGRIPFSFAWSGAELAILSAHKLGGPKGVGALIVRDGYDIGSLSRGGGQELGRRSGTENVVGIAGFGAAIEAAMKDLSGGIWDSVNKLRIILEERIEAACPDTICVGQDMKRLPNTSCLLSPGWKGESQVMAMDLAGFAVSAGSACSSGKVKSSRVLQAMGYSEAEAASAIRVSLGPDTTEDEVSAFVDVWSQKREKQRKRAA